MGSLITLIYVCSIYNGDNLMRTKFLTAVISIALLMSVFGSSMVSASLTPTTPIAIDGNSDLDPYPGSGNASNPKVIANLSIDGQGGVGISISNVDIFLTIYNCTIYNSSYGIKIVGSSNISVDNNTITGVSGSHGILLDSSTAYLDRNKLTGCSIELRHSDSNVGVQAYIDAMNITSNNTVNGAPVFFLKNQNMDNASVPTGSGEVILLNVTYANVNGLNMRGGAVIFWSSHITVENCVITGAYDAIYSFSSSYCTYANNRIVDAYHAGVRLYLSSQNTVSNTTITHNAIYSTAYGIVVMNGSNDNVIVGSNIRDTYDGISLSYANSNTVSDNILIHAMGNGIYLELSNSNTVSDNLVNGSSLRGIHSQLSNVNVLFNNTIVGALTSGIILWKSFADTVSMNKIFDSVSYGINLTACNAAVNHIFANVLIGNHGSTSVYNVANIQAFDDSVNSWNNATIGNYWGDWTAPDANKDGIVDSAYAIAGGVSADNHPIALTVKILSPASNLYTNSTSAALSGTTSGYVLANVTWYNAATGISGQGSGISTWTASAGLVLGVNNISINATDSQGLKVSDNVTVICDTVNASLTIVSPVSGSINTTGMVTVQWNVSDALSGIAKTEISTNGNTWTLVTGTSYNLTLADGAYIVYVKVTDNAGNVNQTSVSFSVDTVKPVIVINSPSNGSAVNNGSVLLQWTASDAISGIAKTEISTNGTNWTLVTGTSYNLTLADGTYTVYVKVTDLVGFVNQTSVNFTVDTVKPVIIINSPSNGSINTTGTVTLLWNASDAFSGILKTEISTDGMNWTLVNGTSNNLTLVDAAYIVYVKVTDNAGNVNQTSVSFIVDTVKPVIIINSPSNGSINITGSVTVQWTASDATSGILKTEISTDNTTWATVTGNSHVLTLADGSYTVYMKVTDQVGFVNQTSVSFIVDTVKPVIVINSPSNGSVNITGSVTVQWTASDATSGILRTEMSTDGTTWTNVTGTSQVLELADGSYTVYVKVTDNAGNFNQTSVSFIVESSTPVVTAKSPVGSGVSKEAAISVQFSEAMNTIATTISVNGISGVMTWIGNNATFTPSSALAYNTTYTVTVSGEDLYGKALATASWTFTTLKDEGKITGTLKDASGNATAGANVALSNGMTTETDANGYFEFNNVTSGSYTLTISKDGYKTFTQNVTTAAGETNALGTLSAEANPAGTGTSNDNTLLIGAGIIGIVALLVGGFLVMTRRKKKQA